MKFSTLYSNDKTTTEDVKIELATSKYELHQMINGLIHVLDNLFFRTDLIFTSQSNLVVDSSVHLSLHRNYHHQIKLTRDITLRAKEHLISNYLISTNPSGFKTGGSCISHVLSITHGINESFDKGNTFKVCLFTYQRHLIRFAMKV